MQSVNERNGTDISTSHQGMWVRFRTHQLLPLCFAAREGCLQSLQLLLVPDGERIPLCHGIGLSQIPVDTYGRAAEDVQLGLPQAGCSAYLIGGLVDCNLFFDVWTPNGILLVLVVCTAVSKQVGYSKGNLLNPRLLHVDVDGGWCSARKLKCCERWLDG